MQNRGGCRIDIQEGNLSFGSVFGILPLSNTLSTFEMTGEQIHLILEEGSLETKSTNKPEIQTKIRASYISIIRCFSQQQFQPMRTTSATSARP
jgi:2',3'-cyclic-nucleotide 2'-phosphodiesterase (5'-nucleotidase family)